MRDGADVRNLDRSVANPAQQAAVPYVDISRNVARCTDNDAALQRAIVVLSQSGVRIHKLLKYLSEAGAQRHRQAGAQ